jgi:ATP-dependent Clp protease ATP-binding subunit ClpX
MTIKYLDYLGTPEKAPPKPEIAHLDTDVLTEKKRRLPTPREIYAKFDKYVVGQEQAKKSLAVMLYQHYVKSIKKNFKFNNVCLLVGSSGCGKTTLLNAVKRITEYPCVYASAGNMVEHGICGGTKVSDIAKQITKMSGSATKLREHAIILIDEVDKIKNRENGDYGRSTDGVQNDLLSFLDGTGLISRNNYEYKNYDTRNFLFILAGTFQELTQYSYFADDLNTDALVRYGLLPEFAARIGRLIPLQQLTETDLRKIIRKKIKEYDASLAIMTPQEKQVYEELIMLELTKNDHSPNPNARSIDAILQSLYEDKLFNI